MDRGRSSANSMAQFFGQLRAAIDQRQQSVSAYGDRMMGYGSYGTQQMSGAASYSGLGSHSTSAVSSLGLRPGYAEATSLGYIRGDESSWQEPRRRSLPDRSELLTSSLPQESMLDDISYRRDRLDESRYGRYERDVGYGVDSRVSVGLRSPIDPEPPVMSNSARLGRMLEAVGVHDEVALRNLISTAVQNQAAPSRPPRSLTEDELYDAAYGKERHRHTRRDNTERSRSQEQRHRSREDVDRRRSHGGARSRSPISRSRDREPQRKSSVGRTSSSRTGVHQSSGKGGSSQRDVNTLSLEELQVVQQVAEQFGIDDMSIALEALKFVKQLGNTSAQELKLFADLVRGMNEGRLSLSQVATKLPRHLAEVVVKGNIRPALLQMIIDSTADPGGATDRRNRSRSRRGMRTRPAASKSGSLAAKKKAIVTANRANRAAKGQGGGKKGQGIGGKPGQGQGKLSQHQINKIVVSGDKSYYYNKTGKMIILTPQIIKAIECNPRHPLCKILKKYAKDKEGRLIGGSGSEGAKRKRRGKKKPQNTQASVEPKAGSKDSQGNTNTKTEAQP